MQSIKRQPQTQTKGSTLGIFIVLAVVAFLAYLGATAVFEKYEQVRQTYDDQRR